MYEKFRSIPLEMEIRDNTLLQYPAEELKGLRKKKLFSVRNLSIEAEQNLFPLFTGEGGEIEIRCQWIANKAATGMILKSDEDDYVKVSYDAQTSEIVVDFSKTKNGGIPGNNGLHGILRSKVPLDSDRVVELCLYFDRSVLEVNLNGHHTAGRWYPDQPEAVKVGFFSREQDNVLRSVNVWELGTIWRKYVGEEGTGERGDRHPLRFGYDGKQI